MPYKNTEDKRKYDRDHKKEKTRRRRKCREKGVCIDCGSAKECLNGTYCNRCKYKNNRRNAEARIQLKTEILSHYGKGGKCLCCWEGCLVDDPDMLSLDHINNSGNEERKRGAGGGVAFYAKVKKSGYPLGLQTLCYNHQWKKEIVRRRKSINLFLEDTKYANTALCR